MLVGDHQLYPAQAAVGQRPQEPGPERLSLGGACGDAQNFALAVLVDRHGHYHGTADYPTALTYFEVSALSQR